MYQEHISNSIFKNMLEIHYSEYTDKVSGPLNAMSWEAINTIANHIIERNRKREENPSGKFYKRLETIIDLGSGISSVMLRLLKLTKQIPGDTTIFSVDHDLKWLEKTMEYCEQKGLPQGPNESFILWDDFFVNLPDWVKFNVIIFDIDHTGQRPKYFKFVLKKMIGPQSGTDLWLDDMHKDGLRTKLLSILSENTRSYRIRNFMKEKEESTGRYFALVDNILI